jgi:hypothetical protein
MSEEFESFSFNDFKQTFLLVEKDLDKSPSIRLGELSRSLSKTNIEVGRKLNRWAANISSKVRRYAERLKKRPDTALVRIRHVPVGDGKTEAAAIIMTTIEGVGEIQTSVFDNNKIVIKMPDSIASVVNKGRNRKFMSNKDRVADYLIGILEKVA